MFKRLSTAQRLLLLLVSLLFLSSGVLHLVATAKFAKIVPSYLPRPRLLVWVSGVAEIAGALGLLVPPLRRVAAWGLVALLVAVFPANVYMATNGIQVTAEATPPWILWGRLPLQGVLIWLVIWCTTAKSSL